MTNLLSGGIHYLDHRPLLPLALTLHHDNTPGGTERQCVQQLDGPLTPHASCQPQNRNTLSHDCTVTLG